MTTITEITELKADMDAKFDRVYDQLAELSTEFNGFREDVRADMNGVREEVNEIREDMNGFRENVNERLDGMDAKLDLLLKAQGIEPGAEVG